jgi:hypothetical protein
VSPLEDANALVDMVERHILITDGVARRIADAGTDTMETEIRERTPVDTNPFRNNPDRPRGALKASVHRITGILVEDLPGGGKRYVGEVVSYDPIVKYVEFDTPAHVIRPTTPGGRLRFQSRDGFIGADNEWHPPGTWVSVEQVEHPGTKGQHMFTLGALAAERMLESDARPELARWKLEVEAVRT